MSRETLESAAHAHPAPASAQPARNNKPLLIGLALLCLAGAAFMFYRTFIAAPIGGGIQLLDEPPSSSPTTPDSTTPTTPRPKPGPQSAGG
jgi:hypothetical protein